MICTFTILARIGPVAKDTVGALCPIDKNRQITQSRIFITDANIVTLIKGRREAFNRIQPCTFAREANIVSCARVSVITTRSIDSVRINAFTRGRQTIPSNLAIVFDRTILEAQSLTLPSLATVIQSAKIAVFTRAVFIGRQATIAAFVYATAGTGIANTTSSHASVKVGVWIAVITCRPVW